MISTEATCHFCLFSVWWEIFVASCTHPDSSWSEGMFVHLMTLVEPLHCWRREWATWRDWSKCCTAASHPDSRYSPALLTQRTEKLKKQSQCPQPKTVNPHRWEDMSALCVCREWKSKMKCIFWPISSFASKAKLFLETLMFGCVCLLW